VGLLPSIFSRKSSSLKPDQEVGIKVVEGELKRAFRSKVRGISENSISLVIEEEDEEHNLPLKPGMKAEVYYTSKGGVYSFETIISDRKPGPTPELILLKPAEDSAIRKTERNERDRFTRKLKATYRIIPRLTTYTAVTEEIDEFSVRLASDEPLELQSVLELNIYLPGDREPVQTMGTAVECRESIVKGKRKIYHVEITFLPGKLAPEDKKRIAELGKE